MRLELQTYLEQKTDPAVWVNPDTVKAGSAGARLYYNRLTNTYVFDYPVVCCP